MTWGSPRATAWARRRCGAEVARGLPFGIGVQGLDHLAMCTVAALAQCLQPLFQCVQLMQACAHMCQVGIQGGAGLVLGAAVQGIYVEQGAHLVQGHIHGSAQPDQAQTVNIGWRIDAVAVIAASWWVQQPFLFVKTNVGGGNTAQARSHPDAAGRHTGRVCICTGRRQGGRRGHGLDLQVAYSFPIMA